MVGVLQGMTKLVWAGFIAVAGLAACGGKQPAGGGDGDDMSPMDRKMSDSTGRAGGGEVRAGPDPTGRRT